MNYKLVYRRYAGLFFTIAVDVNDNELAYLETIHLFVELLDKYFSNVCELDIVFHFNKVRTRAYSTKQETDQLCKFDSCVYVHHSQPLAGLLDP